jgi:hypothetical protein
MILIDANLLLYACHPRARPAREKPAMVVEDVLSGGLRGSPGLDWINPLD